MGLRPRKERKLKDDDKDVFKPLRDDKVLTWTVERLAQELQFRSEERIQAEIDRLRRLTRIMDELMQKIKEEEGKK